jgi:hypothetical protein
VLRIGDFYSSRIPDLGSRIPDLGSRIPDLGSRIPDLGSQIPDPKIAIKERGEKKFVVIPFFVATFSQNCKLFNFFNVEEKNLTNFQKKFRTFYPKNCH